MTPKQYENVGRAVAIMTLLDIQAEKLEPLKDELVGVLRKLVGMDKAYDFVKNRYGVFCPLMNEPNEVFDLVRELETKNNKGEIK